MLELLDLKRSFRFLYIVIAKSRILVWEVEHLAGVRVIVDALPCSSETQVHSIIITAHMGSTTAVIKRREQRVLLVRFK